MTLIFTLITIFVLSFLVSYTLNYLIIFVCHKYNLLAQPKEDRWHKKPTALFGGISFVMVILAFATFLMVGIANKYILTDVVFKSGFSFSFKQGSNPYLGLLIGSFIVFLSGLIDDIYNLKPHIKIICQLLAVSIATYFGVKVAFFTSPIIALPLTFLWIMTITNAFNLLDNMDGLSSGIGLIVSLMLCIVSYMRSDQFLFMLSLLTLAGLLGFFLHNKFPAKIFMGDCGSQFIGFFLGSLTIIGTWHHTSNLAIAISLPLIILSLPVFDTLYVSVMRTLYGKKITDGGKDHLSHRLVAFGLSERRAVNTLITISLILSLISLATIKYFSFYMTIATFILFIVGFVLFAISLSQIKVYKKKGYIFDEEPKNLPVKILFRYKRRILEVLTDIILLFLSLFIAYILKYEEKFTGPLIVQFGSVVMAFVTIKMFCFMWAGVYKGNWKYVGVPEVFKVLKGMSLSILIIIVYLVIANKIGNFSRAIIVLDVLLTGALILGVRMGLRLFKEYVVIHKKNLIPVIVKESSLNDIVLALQKIRISDDLKLKPVGLYCDAQDINEENQSTDSIYGLKVFYNKEDIDNFIKVNKINRIVSLKDLYSEGHQSGQKE